MTFDPSTVAVVLAAGAGSRFGGSTHKLAAPLDGATVLHRVLEAVTSVGFAEVLVITGARSLAELDPRAPASITEIHHSGWAEGQATTVQVAIGAARERGAGAVVIGLGDQPGIPPAAWAAVAASDSPIAVATYAGRRANPVRLAASVWQLLPIQGDEGARTVMRVRPELVEEVPCQGNPGDIDTVEDLDSWN
jgi:CTP:molybdopterin cytidylyltransferase MocA